MQLSKLETKGYTSREERATYTYKKYGKFLQGRVLDVGCGNAHLKEFVESEYVGIDITGKPEIVFDLEEGRLPFRANSFDCVVCTDVLEHLEKIHNLFFELTRVTREYVIISLPNNWNPFVTKFFKAFVGRDYLVEDYNEENGEKYGLPIEPPMDRHRWFFNYEEAEKFIYGIAKKAQMNVLICEPYCRFGYRRPFVNFVAKTVIGEIKHNNFFALTMWAILIKREEGNEHIE